MASFDVTMNSLSDNDLMFKAKFQGKILDIPPLDGTCCCVLDLKRFLEDETSVPIQRQKLIGLVKGKLPSDETLLNEIIKSKPKHTTIFTLMGTPDSKLFIDPADRDDLPEVFDDFALDYRAESKRWHRSQRNARKLAEFTKKTEINWINEPREDKLLLVLDLDFSRHDNDPSATAKRPFMDEFLIQCWPHYDLVIWSATSWRWLEIKLTELGMLSHPQYKICCVLDKTSMFRIVSEVGTEQHKQCSSSSKARKLEAGQVKHSVKPLEILWNKFPTRWNKHNTVHVDDLSRNFALNPTNGIQCSPFKRDDPASKDDTELRLIAFYLVYMATHPPIASASSSSSSSVLRKEAAEGSSSSTTIDLLAWDHSKWRENATTLQILTSLNPP